MSMPPWQLLAPASSFHLDIFVYMKRHSVMHQQLEGGEYKLRLGFEAFDSTGWNEIFQVAWTNTACHDMIQGLQANEVGKHPEDQDGERHHTMYETKFVMDMEPGVSQQLYKYT